MCLFRARKPSTDLAFELSTQFDAAVCLCDTSPICHLIYIVGLTINIYETVLTNI